ncbi:hypothetical protein VNO78_22757 [Psophocarpus tetragonolobus]|uniref:Uncharacterized protein n=1 Tax=Psophocarpus tetragonolobus TaxID=3891 RepID=A0AAN9XC54_PSOTE
MKSFKSNFDNIVSPLFLTLVPSFNILILESLMRTVCFTLRSCLVRFEGNLPKSKRQISLLEREVPPVDYNG